MSLLKKPFPFVYTSKTLVGSKTSKLLGLLNTLFSANIVGSMLKKSDSISVTKNIT